MRKIERPKGRRPLFIAKYSLRGQRSEREQPTPAFLSTAIVAQLRMSRADLSMGTKKCSMIVELVLFHVRMTVDMVIRPVQLDTLR